ncbi:MAG: hypothetical protein CV045_12810 [Cyanobacteria bacterium M5B4]|nr:MAG: hypothetical protein CV045_12810 [Cyanobacteria bacterium M5B4]
METYALENGHTAVFDAPDAPVLLNRMLDKIERLEAKVNQFEQLVEQAPKLMALFTDTMDGIYGNSLQAGVNIEERIKMGLHLLTTITEPETMRALCTLTGQLEQIATIAEQAPGLTAMAVDIADNFYASMAQGGVDLETAARNGLDAAGRLVNLLQSDEIKALMDSGVLDPKTLVIIGNAANALVESRTHVEKAGPFTLLRALFNSDLQRTLGFLLSFGQHFGKRMEQYTRATEEGKPQ